MSSIGRIGRLAVVSGLLVGCVAGFSGIAHADDEDGRDGKPGKATTDCYYDVTLTSNQCVAEDGEPGRDGDED